MRRAKEWRRSAVSNEEGIVLRYFLVVPKRRTVRRSTAKRSALCGGSMLFRSRVPGPPPAPPGAISGAAAARAAPRRRKARCHGAQARPRGASLGPLPPTVPPGSTLVRQCGATARRSRDGARVRAPPNTLKWPRGQPRGLARASPRRKRPH